MKRKFCLCLLVASAIFAQSAFAKDWYVCLSSFKNKDNAANLQKTLEKNGLPSFQEEFEKSDGTYYRVFLNRGYSSRDEAHKKCAELEKSALFKRLKITGLWISYTEPYVVKEPVVIEPKFAEPEPVVPVAAPAAAVEPKVEIELPEPEPVEEEAVIEEEEAPEEPELPVQEEETFEEVEEPEEEVPELEEEDEELPQELPEDIPEEEAEEAAEETFEEAEEPEEEVPELEEEDEELPQELPEDIPEEEDEEPEALEEIEDIPDFE